MHSIIHCSICFGMVLHYEERATDNHDRLCHAECLSGYQDEQRQDSTEFLPLDMQEDET